MRHVTTFCSEAAVQTSEIRKHTAKESQLHMTSSLPLPLHRIQRTVQTLYREAVQQSSSKRKSSISNNCAGRCNGLFRPRGRPCLLVCTTSPCLPIKHWKIGTKRAGAQHLTLFLEDQLFFVTLRVLFASSSTPRCCSGDK